MAAAPYYVYRGRRAGERREDLGETVVTVTKVVEVHGELRPEPLDPQLDVRNHSPTGFEWGYHGSGPAQLALALCLHHLVHTVGLAAPEAQRQALYRYQAVKERLVARWQGMTWELSGQELQALLAQLQLRDPLPPLLPELVVGWKDEGPSGPIIIAGRRSKFWLSREAAQELAQLLGWDFQEV